MKDLSLFRLVLLLSIVSSAIIFGCNANANSSKKPSVYKMPLISDVDTAIYFYKKPVSKVIVSLSYQLSDGVPISSIRNSHKPQFIERVAKNTERLIFPFLKNKGFYGEECRGYEYNLIIFVVSKSILQDNNRFRNFFMTASPGHSMEGHTLYGYYDSTLEIKNDSTILVTDVGGQLNEEVLAHELSHYWWDRLCVASKIKQDPEEFSREFQNYYMRHR